MSDSKKESYFDRFVAQRSNDQLMQWLHHGFQTDDYSPIGMEDRMSVGSNFSDYWRSASPETNLRMSQAISKVGKEAFLINQDLGVTTDQDRKYMASLAEFTTIFEANDLAIPMIAYLKQFMTTSPLDTIEYQVASDFITTLKSLFGDHRTQPLDTDIQAFFEETLFSDEFDPRFAAMFFVSLVNVAEPGRHIDYMIRFLKIAEFMPEYFAHNFIFNETIENEYNKSNLTFVGLLGELELATTSDRQRLIQALFAPASEGMKRRNNWHPPFVIVEQNDHCITVQRYESFSSPPQLGETHEISAKEFPHVANDLRTMFPFKTAL